MASTSTAGNGQEMLSGPVGESAGTGIHVQGEYPRSFVLLRFVVQEILNRLLQYPTCNCHKMIIFVDAGSPA